MGLGQDAHPPAAICSAEEGSKALETPTCPIPSFAKVKARVFLDVQSTAGVESSWGVRTDHARIFECPASGLRFRLPAPREEIKSFYESFYHDRMVGEDETRTEAYRKENRERAQFLKRFCSKGRVLDVGCSTGSFGSELAAAGFQVLGSDISEYACAKAKEHLGENNVFCADIDALVPRFRGELDAITMMDVIEHFEDVVTPLESMREMLRPGGILFLRTPTLSSPFYAIAELSYRLSGGFYKDAILKIYHAEHFYFFTERAMRALLQDTGYEVLAIEPDPLLWENFRSAEMRQGPLTNAVLAAVYFAGRAANRGHGMKVVARRPR